MVPNLTDLTLPQLRQLAQHVRQEMQRRQRLTLPQAVTKRSRGRCMPIRFRHPDHPHWCWSGQGSWPVWVRLWFKDHGSLTGVAVVPHYEQEKR